MTRRPIVLYTICIAYVTTRASSPLFNTSNTQSLIRLARSFRFAPLTLFLPNSRPHTHTFPISLLPRTHIHILRTHNFISLSKFSSSIFSSCVASRGARSAPMKTMRKNTQILCVSINSRTAATAAAAMRFFYW